MRCRTSAPSSPRAGWVLPGELGRQGGGVPPGPGRRRPHDLTTGLSGSWPSAASSGRMMAGPRLGTAALAGGSGVGNRGKKGRRQQRAGGSERPFSWLSVSQRLPALPAGFRRARGSGEAYQERSWQPRSRSAPLGASSPKGNISFCTSGALGRAHACENR